MSYIIDFYISCRCVSPKVLLNFTPKYGWLKAPVRLRLFSYPSGCPRFDGCQACIDCYREIHRRFQSGEISFYCDPRSVYGTYHVKLNQIICPRPAGPVSDLP